VDEVNGQCDVAIIGAGLAGLTLALQLKRTTPTLDIVVFERNSLPPPHAAHKVGEATVEIGAHYLAHTLGLEGLLEETQLRKFGLRLFFGSGQHDDLAKADELGASRLLPAISYQLDRGKLEGDLANMLQELSVDVRQQCLVKSVSMGRKGDDHELEIIHENARSKLRCRWLIDASSRAALLKRSLKLRSPIKHKLNAAWFRLDASVSVDDWSDSMAWKERCGGRSRRPSTNHLMGSGYWAWIIPLVGDRTSIGLVADPGSHSLSAYKDFESLKTWLCEHQPVLGDAVCDVEETLMDYHVLKNLSQNSQKVWSGDRWALTGESGLFADPFYSPGTDFIGISNTLICDLITRDQTQSERAVRSAIYEKMYLSFFGSTMSLFEDQYGGFGDTRLMVVKSTWDYAYYWSVLAWMFFRNVMTDLDFLRLAQPELTRIRALNEKMQATFRQKALDRHEDKGRGRFFDQIEMPVLADLNAALLQPPAGLEKEFADNCQRLEALAPLLLKLLAAGKSQGNGNCSLLGDLESRLSA
jgi:flavin-dependent dehydrogenase